MIEGIPFSVLGPAGLLALAWAIPFLQIFRGKIVPVSFLKSLQETTEAAIARERANAKEWKDAHAISEASRATYAAQVEELLEHARTTDALIRSLTATVEGRGERNPT